MKKSDVRDVAKQLLEEHDEVWFQDPDAKEHYHNGQTSGEKHADAYYARKNPDGTVYVKKYHSDD